MVAAAKFLSTFLILFCAGAQADCFKSVNGTSPVVRGHADHSANLYIFLGAGDESAEVLLRGQSVNIREGMDCISNKPPTSCVLEHDGANAQVVDEIYSFKLEELPSGIAISTALALVTDENGERHIRLDTVSGRRIEFKKMPASECSRLFQPRKMSFPAPMGDDPRPAAR